MPSLIPTVQLVSLSQESPEYWGCQRPATLPSIYMVVGVVLRVLTLTEPSPRLLFSLVISKYLIGSALKLCT